MRTLKDLLHNVDAKRFQDNPIYQAFLNVRPEYGLQKRIKVRMIDGHVKVTNVHVGSLADVLTFGIDTADDVRMDDNDLLAAILDECANEGCSEADNEDFWSEMTNLQKAKIVR